MNSPFLLSVLSLFISLNCFAQDTPIWSQNMLPDSGSTLHGNAFDKSPRIHLRSDSIITSGVQLSGSQYRYETLRFSWYDLQGTETKTAKIALNASDSMNIIDYAFDKNHNLFLLAKRNLWNNSRTELVFQKFSPAMSPIWSYEKKLSLDTSYTPQGFTLINDTSAVITVHKIFNAGERETFSVFHVNGNGRLLSDNTIPDSQEVSFFQKQIFTLEDTAYIFAYLQSTNSYFKLMRFSASKGLQYSGDIPIEDGFGVPMQVLPTGFLVSSQRKFRVSWYDHSGARIWSDIETSNLPPNTFGDNVFYSLVDASGNLYAIGRHNGGPQNGTNFFVTKFTPNGGRTWSKRYTFNGIHTDIATIGALKHGHLYIAGRSQKAGLGADFDYLVLKADTSNGNLTGKYRYDNAGHGTADLTSLLILDDGKIALTGTTKADSTLTGQIRFTTQLLGDIIISIDPEELQSNSVFPNPVIRGQELRIQGTGYTGYQIADLSGKMIQAKNLEKQKALQSVVTDNLPAGLFYLLLQTDTQTQVVKLLVR